MLYLINCKLIPRLQLIERITIWSGLIIEWLKKWKKLSVFIDSIKVRFYGLIQRENTQNLMSRKYFAMILVFGQWQK